MGMAARLGAVARAARQVNDLTQLEVAQEAGVSEAVINLFENGRRMPRKIDEIVEAYERLCNMPPRTLWRQAAD